MEKLYKIELTFDTDIRFKINVFNIVFYESIYDARVKNGCTILLFYYFYSNGNPIDTVKTQYSNQQKLDGT